MKIFLNVGEQWWRWLHMQNNLRWRWQDPFSPVAEKTCDYNGGIIWRCLWNPVEITHSFSSPVGHAWTKLFVCETRRALTRLLSACPGLAWGMWYQQRLDSTPSTRPEVGGWVGNMFYRVRYKITWLQTSGTDIKALEKCFYHSSCSLGERFQESRVSK